MRLFGLIGHPLTHSFSKKYFTAKFEKEGWEDCQYELFPLPDIETLPALIAAHPDLQGLNVTIPHKKNVLPYLQDRSGIPEGLDACNCIRIRDGKLSGFNTDIIGFRDSLIPLLAPHHKKALVLGNGGATAAVKYVLTSLGIHYEIVSRQKHSGSTLRYEEITEAVMKEHLLIINTTPLGMHPHTEQCPAIPYEQLGPQHLLYDLIYNPATTLFLSKAAKQGAVIKNGEEMLLLQAAASWDIWNRS